VPAWLQALQQTEAAQKAAVMLGGVAALAAAVALGRGVPLVSWELAACAGASAGALWRRAKLQRLHASLTFTDWVIAEKHAHAVPSTPTTV
jgi:hypothetical protein